MTRRILVTGGCGFIGSHLVDALRAHGDRVTVLDDLSTGKRSNVSAHRGQEGFDLVVGSVLDATLVDALAAEHELVYHLAAAVGVRHIVGDPVSSVLTNVRGTEHVLAAAQAHRRRVVFASTSEVYGKSAAVPFREDGDRLLGPTNIHRWSYATAKALDEHLAFAYAERGLSVGIVRYFNSYGPRLDEQGYGSVIARFIGQAMAGGPITVHGDGQQTRSFTYVSDTVRGTILAGENADFVGQVVNIGSEREISIGEVAHVINRIVGRGGAIEHVPHEAYYGPGFEDTRRRVPDVSRARKLLGFSAAVPLETGLRNTVGWCEANYAGAGATR